eukprot:TRINITY_DN10968_c0_g1_i1.p1 TRINITY_DN10968_c0_g1~~TRINITY_DN10968_c0_g1_i1.p1  ORF type:complete len:174 (-),score=42.88 TRINITY_DN10968_c0_g1_i1:70-591(-)
MSSSPQTTQEENEKESDIREEGLVGGNKQQRFSMCTRTFGFGPFSSKLSIKAIIDDRTYKAGEKVEVRVEIVNDTKRKLKMIEAHLETIKIVDHLLKKKTVEKSGTDQEYYQGARFPLEGRLNYEGTVNYPLPEHALPSEDKIIHHLVVGVPYATTLGWGKVSVPITVHVESN